MPLDNDMFIQQQQSNNLLKQYGTVLNFLGKFNGLQTISHIFIAFILFMDRIGNVKDNSV